MNLTNLIQKRNEYMIQLKNQGKSNQVIAGLVKLSESRVKHIFSEIRKANGGKLRVSGEIGDLH